MKYVLLFVGTMDDQTRFENQTEAEMAASLSGPREWFDRYSKAGKIVGGEQLQGPQTVSTVQSRDGRRIVTDGPFIESKEVVGGFAIVEVKDRDEALEMAKEWPAGPVEVWPAVER
jgi:hypothetical protein